MENNVTNVSNSSDDYHYDYYDSVSNYDVRELAIVALVYGATLVVGLIGNTLVVVTITRSKKMRSITNLFLVSLASSDLMIVVFCIPIRFVEFFSFSWRMGMFLCKATNYIQTVSRVCSILNLTAMSLERYFAILHPIRAKSICTMSHAYKMIGSVWVLSVLLSCPIIYGQVSGRDFPMSCTCLQHHQLVGETIKVFWCVKNWSHNEHDNLIGGIVYELYAFVVAFIVPVSIMVVAYTSICRELWRGGVIKIPVKEGEQRTGSGVPTEMKLNKSNPNAENQQRKQVVKILLFIMIIFLVCWAPITFNNVLTAFGFLPAINEPAKPFLKPMRQAFSILSYANSCVNPVVYAFLSKNFRRGFRDSVHTCCRRETTRTSSETTVFRRVPRGAGKESAATASSLVNTN